MCQFVACDKGVLLVNALVLGNLGEYRHKSYVYKQDDDHYADQGHLRSPILVSIESSYVRLQRLTLSCKHGPDVQDITASMNIMHYRSWLF